MRYSKTWLGAYVAAAAAMASAPFACASVDNDVGTGDCTPVDGVRCPPPGGGGGAGGVSGSGGAGGGPLMGQGGGGAGGGGAGGGCDGDEACAPADGSLCVGGACTKAQGACDATLFVVVEPADEPLAAAESRDTCFFRTLAPALAAVQPATARVAAYAASSVRVPGPVTVPANVRLEGHTADAGEAVRLEVMAPIADAPLVTMAAGSALAGFALDGKASAQGVAASSGSVRLDGPLTITATKLALALTGDVAATVHATATAPVFVTGNARGVAVGPTAGLEMTGEGGAGVAVEKTSAGAGVLVEKGAGSDVPTKLVGVTFRENTSGGGPDGAGAVEVRQNRQVLVEACTFEKNQRSVTLNAESTNDTNLFLGVKLSGNDFANALPAPGQGAAVCGSKFVGPGTEVHLEPVANTFPTAAADCAAIVPAFGCTGGFDVGFDVPSTAPVLVCPAGLR